METSQTNLRETQTSDGTVPARAPRKRFDPTRLFVQHDRLPWFWFLVAVTVTVLAALDRYHLVQQFKQRERVVIIDPSQTYYVSPLLQFAEAKDLHVQQAELATVAFLERNPKDFASANWKQADIIGLRRINDDNAPPLLELLHEMIAVQRRENRDNDRNQEPEPRQAVALHEKLSWVKTLAGSAGRNGSIAGLGFAEIGLRCFHKFSVVVFFGLGDQFAHGFVAGNIVA